MERITEKMFSLFMDEQAVKTVKLTRSFSPGPNKIAAWGIEVELELPRTSATLYRWMMPDPSKVTFEIPRFTETLADYITQKKGRRLWVNLIPRRQAVEGKPMLKTVASIDRFILNLQALGAGAISIEIHLGA